MLGLFIPDSRVVRAVDRNVPVEKSVREEMFLGIMSSWLVSLSMNIVP